MTTAETQYPLGSDPTELERLDQRMSEELARARAVFAFPILVTAWATRTA